MNELAHHSADDDQRRFAAGGDAGFKGLAPLRPPDRDHRGHINILEEGKPILKILGFLLTRIKARVSHRAALERGNQQTACLLR